MNPTDDALLKAYEELLKNHQNAENTTESNRSLFERNHDQIEETLTAISKDYDAVIQAYKAQAKQLDQALKDLYDEEIKRTQKEFIEKNESFEKELNDSETLKSELFEETFKTDETIDHTYQTVYDTANAQQDEHTEIILTDIKQFSQDHDALQKELNERAAHDEHALNAGYKKEKTHFDEAFKRLSELSSVAKSDIVKEKEALKETHAKIIRTTEENYHTAVKPYVESMGQIQMTYSKKEEALQSAHNKKVLKVEGYYKEARKINDVAAEKTHLDAIRELELNHKNALTDLSGQLAEALEPVKLEYDQINAKYQNELCTQKLAYMNALLKAMTDLEESKTDEMLKLDDLNLNFNIAEKKYLASLELAKVDLTIQTLNYDQKKFEQTLFKEKEKALLGPAFDETVLKAKELLQSGHAEQEKIRQEADYQLDFAKRLFDLQRTHAANEKNSAQRFLEAYYSHDKSLIDLRLERQTHQTLIKRESLINTYYQKFAENYTALSSGWLSPWKDPLKMQQSIELTRTTEYLNGIKSKALADHENLLNAIEHVYQSEMAPLKEAYKLEDALKVKEIHKQEAAFKKQQNTLGLKSDKNPKKHEKALEVIQADHQKMIKKINRQFDTKVQELKALMEQIESARTNSKEEAETLLNHILDQADTRLKETETLMHEEVRLFEAGETYLDKSAGLFRWFQDKRLEDTLSALETLNQAKRHAFTIKEKDILDALYEKCEKIDDQEARTHETYQKVLHDMKTSHQQKLLELSKDHDAYLTQNTQEIKAQLKLVDNHKASLNEEYEAQIKELDMQMNQARNKYFLEKERIEQSLKESLSQLKTDYTAAKAQKESQLRSSLDAYQGQFDVLKAHLEKDAIHTLQAKDMRYVEGILERSIPMSSITEAV